MRKIVFCDLDGTLLNKNGEISDYTKNFFAKFINDGNTLIIATGRSYFGCIHFYYELKLNSLLICDNGGYIVNPNDPSFNPIIRFMPLNVFHDFFVDFKEKVASVLFNYGEKVYTYKHIKEFEWLINNTNKEDITEIEFDKLDISPAGMMLLVHNACFEELDNLVWNKYKDHLFARQWGKDKKYTIYEVCGIASHKGAAVELAIDILNVKREDTVCFGDGMNDTEMIRDSYHGVAMKNAYDTLKEVSKYETEFNNDNDGVCRYLEKYLKGED